MIDNKSTLPENIKILFEDADGRGFLELYEKSSPEARLKIDRWITDPAPNWYRIDAAKCMGRVLHAHRIASAEGIQAHPAPAYRKLVGYLDVNHIPKSISDNFIELFKSFFRDVIGFDPDKQTPVQKDAFNPDEEDMSGDEAPERPGSLSDQQKTELAQNEILKAFDLWARNIPDLNFRTLETPEHARSFEQIFGKAGDSRREPLVDIGAIRNEWAVHFSVAFLEKRKASRRPVSPDSALVPR